MDAALEAIKDAMDKETGDGRDHAKAVELADAYVKKHPEQFEGLKNLGLPECVKAVSVFRDAGLDEEQWRVETWLLHKFEPQNIGGEYQAQVRFG